MVRINPMAVLSFSLFMRCPHWGHRLRVYANRPRSRTGMAATKAKMPRDMLISVIG